MSPLSPTYFGERVDITRIYGNRICGNLGRRWVEEINYLLPKGKKKKKVRSCGLTGPHTRCVKKETTFYYTSNIVLLQYQVSLSLPIWYMLF